MIIRSVIYLFIADDRRRRKHSFHSPPAATIYYRPTHVPSDVILAQEPDPADGVLNESCGDRKAPDAFADADYAARARGHNNRPNQAQPNASVSAVRVAEVAVSCTCARSHATAKRVRGSWGTLLAAVASHRHRSADVIGPLQLFQGALMNGICGCSRQS